MNSNDEIINVNQDQHDNYQDSLPVTGRGKLLNKMYRERETEAKKYIKAIDNAVQDFKHHRVRKSNNDQGKNRNLREDNLSDETKTELNSNINPVSLHDKYRAEVQHHNFRGKHNNYDEKSVRLNDSQLHKRNSIKASTLASEDYLTCNKSRDKKMVPTPKDLANKNDYMFFELLSVYTGSYVQDED